MRRTLAATVAQPERSRFLSEADCRDLVQRLVHATTGGGYTAARIQSVWMGNVRWARNRITTSGEVQDNVISVIRNVNGARGSIQINDTTDAALLEAAQRAERLTAMNRETTNCDLIARLPLEPMPTPALFSEATYQLDAQQRASAALRLAQQAKGAGMLSAGYIEVAAVGMGILDTAGRVRYFPYTQARYSVTVRDPKGTGSGWAGVDWYDWKKIDADAITQRALEKCLQSRNPVAIEPGRYTTILEPQAVADFVGLTIRGYMGRAANEWYVQGGLGPFMKSQPHGMQPGYSKLGESVVDERITISADPMDPDLGFPPFAPCGTGRDSLVDPFVTAVYHPTTWVEKGVLVNLGYNRFEIDHGRPDRHENLGMPNSGAFRMSGGETSVAEMIATTKRGLLVTRFDQVRLLDKTSQLYRGYTRDGLWLIERGKVSQPVRNLVFTESVLLALNNVDQLGPPQRVFHPHVALREPWAGGPQPIVVPPLKIHDFSFTALTNAI